MKLNSGSQGFRLLTPGNPKTEKGRGLGYWTFILHLAPAKLSGFNVCPMATAGCKRACLNTAGRGGISRGGILTYGDVARGVRNEIQNTDDCGREHSSSIAPSSWRCWHSKLPKLANARGHKADIRWETVPVGGFPNRKHLPANYHLTFSLADNNDDHAIAALEAGINVAAVFRNVETVSRYIASGLTIGATRAPVMRGDDTDLRFLDAPGHIVALFAKGNAKRDTSGLVRD